MKKIYIISVVILCLALAATAYAIVLPKPQEQASPMRGTIASLQDNLNTLSQQLDELEAQLSVQEPTGDIEALSGEVQGLQMSVNGIEEDLFPLQVKVDMLWAHPALGFGYAVCSEDTECAAESCIGEANCISADEAPVCSETPDTICGCVSNICRQV